MRGNRIQVWDTTLKTSQNIMIEILIDEEPYHKWAPNMQDSGFA